MRICFLLCLCTLAAPAAAEVRRCLAEDGTTIYTDRACEHFQARELSDLTAPATSTERAPTAPQDAPAAEPPLSSYGPVASDCARTPEALVEALRRRLEARDVNALAGLYHWPGMGKAGAHAVMDRLETLATRSDGAVELVYPEAAFVVLDPQAYPGLPPEDPEAVRIGYFHEGGLSEAAPAPATLRVIRYAGCWWLHF